jgi:hypothetical protein
MPDHKDPPDAPIVGLDDAQRTPNAPAEAAEPDELADIEEFLAEIRAAMEPDSILEGDLHNWHEEPDDVLPV